MKVINHKSQKSKISSNKIRHKLDDAGYNRDIEISKESWLEAKEELKASKSLLGLPSFLKIEESIL